VKQLFYPKYTDSINYRKMMTERGGYGGLFSVVLLTEQESIQFYDIIRIAKGPSLGTNFTLACPYTLLAHFHELDWAEEYGTSLFHP
jgi:cystathionine gamma-synthase